jgi:hypothetical protein
MKIIDKNKNDLHSEKVLTMNHFFREACAMEKKLTHELNIPGDKVEEFRVKVKELYKIMREQKPSPMTE